LIVLLFIYQTLNQVRVSGSQQARRQEKYLLRHYDTFLAKYQTVIATEVSDGWVEALVYAILIFEDFNRPSVARFLEDRLLFRLGLARTLGPMQVASERRVTNEEGVRLGTRRVAALYPEAVAEWRRTYSSGVEPQFNFEQAQWWREYIGRTVAVSYNPDGKYAEEVRSIYTTILKRRYTHLWNSASAITPVAAVAPPN
jgi:hypothetical protein